MQFIKEFFHPSEKCKRVGHNFIVVTKSVRRESFSYGEVVADFKAEFDVCTRCKLSSEPRNEKKIEYYNSCSMPKSLWDEIKNKGYIEI